MDEGLLSHKYRIQAVRMFVSHLIEQFGDRYVHVDSIKGDLNSMSLRISGDQW